MLLVEVGGVSGVAPLHRRAWLADRHTAVRPTSSPALSTTVALPFPRLLPAVRAAGRERDFDSVRNLLAAAFSFKKFPLLVCGRAPRDPETHLLVARDALEDRVDAVPRRMSPERNEEVEHDQWHGTLSVPLAEVRVILIFRLL